MIKSANLVGSVSRNAGGLNESVRRLVQSVRDTGVGVRVLTVEDEFTQADLPAWNPVTVDVFPRAWPDAFGYSPGFLRTLNDYEPDLMHTHGIWMYPSIATAAYCHRHRLPYMISPHGMLDPWAVRHHRWKKVLAFALYESDHVRGARCIRALCEAEARAIRQMGLKNPVAIIPNGIDLPESGKQKAENRNAPWNGLVEPGRKVLLFLSRIHPKKGLPNLIRAWAATLNSQPSSLNSWCLAIAGWDQGGHESELKQLATELGIAWADVRDRTEKQKHSTSNIQDPTSISPPLVDTQLASPGTRHPSLLFLGPQFNEAKIACYRECDAFVLPSFSEGVPMVVLEAWAHHKAVLMTPECNLPEGFARDAAVRIETGTEQIIPGLQKLFAATEAERASIGARGRRFVEEQFTWTTIAEKIKTTYQWMLGAGEPPPWMYEQ
ncbi:MAG: glycosyltransferase [Verrucomicrobia bacterium]|nr:MAG: glycosyltransferase [Verrucomicrobiota bacterium]